MVWIDVVRNGFWRGIRLNDGKPTRGPVAALLGRFATEREALAFLSDSPTAQRPPVITPNSEVQ